MIGTTISHYRILEKLGEGGMGVVYKAQDTKLDRAVALKFLPAPLARSEQDRSRFVQEAKAAAALNHPNVCSVIDIAEHDGQMFIVMEFVDGRTLRDALPGMSYKQAIDAGIQIADGLAAAHDMGIVHRDIKPENIMIRKDGIAQIMDFGLAKIRATGSTITRLTKEGSTIGTAGYMSPEQVQGHDTDHRSDIFSFGVLTYELLTGRLPFKGVHETALAYEIVNVDPAPMSAVKPDIDPELDRIVLECLEKDPSERYQSMAEVSKDLKRFKRESGRQRVSRITAARPIQAAVAPALEAQTATGKTGQARLPWFVAFFFVALAVTFAVLYFRHPASNTEVVRASLLPPEKGVYFIQGGSHLALSPDGRMLAFVATDSLGKNHLYVRPLNALSARELPETDGASYPFWSPDNRNIGFFANGKLKRAEASGGPPTTICDAIAGRGGTWNENGDIVFAPDQTGPLFRVSANAGPPVQLTTLDTARREQTHRWAQFLPDGKHFVYYARCSAGGTVENEGDAACIGSIDGSPVKRLFQVHSSVKYANGYLLYLRDRTLMAQRFDPGKSELFGDVFPVADQIQYDMAFNNGAYSVSDNGILVYQTGVELTGYRLIWCDRSGKESAVQADIGMYYGSVISHSGKKLATQLFTQTARNFDIWLLDQITGIRTRFTFDPAGESTPLWSPDDSRIAFTSDRRGHADIYIKSASGATSEELLYESSSTKQLWDWSPDGTYIIFSSYEPKTKADLYILPMTGDHKPYVFLQTEFAETQAHFSPDGKWVAYVSDETGTNEVYVRPFQGSGAKQQVSNGGGLQPRWKADGREICYYTPDGKMMSVSVNITPSAFEVGSRQQLFDRQARGLTVFMDMTRDGQRFLLRVAEGSHLSSPLTLVTHWDEELRQK